MRPGTRTTTSIALGLASALAWATPKDDAVAGKPGGEALEITPANSRPSFAGAGEYFTGEVAVGMLFQPNDTRNASAATVEFAPGARTAWHTHPAGQTLVVTSGTGWVQAWGGPKLVMKAGDVVWIPADVKHWHGATNDGPMTHTAYQEQLDGEVVEWLEQVSEEQYTSPGQAIPTREDRRQ